MRAEVIKISKEQIEIIRGDMFNSCFLNKNDIAQYISRPLLKDESFVAVVEFIKNYFSNLKFFKQIEGKDYYECGSMLSIKEVDGELVVETHIINHPIDFKYDLLNIIS